jgi:hypothetical protein
MPWGWLVALTLTGALFAWYQKRGLDRDRLRLDYFTAEEFGAYWPLMDVTLLQRLDKFRALLGYPVDISPAVGAIGRPVIGEGENPESGASRSYHNYVIHGAVKAVDVMPRPPGGATVEERKRWVWAAKEAGFTGIGLYPEWRPRAGLHLDVRPSPTGVATTWSGFRTPDGGQTYDADINKGLV